MTVLNIFSLDDTENQNIIACLPEGKHIIGRGDLLKVNDKRVSRKHAVIEVSDDKISLTSVHVNPCFFKAANGKILTVISENQENELKDGDQFALLPESCWFRVKIKREQETNGYINGDGKPTSEINGKRCHDDNLDETNFDSDSKRVRLSLTSQEISIPNSCATTSNITLDLTNNDENYETSPGHLDNRDQGTHLQENNIEETNTSLNLTGTAVKDEINENQDFNMEIEKEPIENEYRDIPSNITVNSSNNSRNTEYNVSTNQQIKEEPLNTSNDDQLHSIEVSSPENDSTSTNISKDDQKPVIKTEIDNQNKNVASGSDTAAKKVRRERCWYGERCFRKNPNHRETFSHPGDQDYDSDPDDDRPECPFGVTCYRKNIEHRREYKHQGKPSPKPRARPKSPSPTSTQNTPPNQKKPRRAAIKKQPKPQNDIDSSQDDYDLDDPFINDGSSDDFQPSDDAIESDSDTDWEDSQEVDEESQEQKRLLKEAKKFTKKENRRLW